MFTNKFDPVDCPYSVVIEDDGRVAYGYLLQDDKIVSDVWLYNCDEARTQSDWNNSAQLPFVNAPDYVDAKLQIRFHDESAIRVQWHSHSGGEPHVAIYYDETLVAKIYPSFRPGRCRAAAKDGPLAKPLV